MEPNNRLKLIQTLNSLSVEQLEQVIFALNPPLGIIPPSIASVGSRASALLQWAQAPGGCGIEKVEQALEEVLNSPTFFAETPQNFKQVAHRFKRNTSLELSALEMRNRRGLLNKVKQSWIKGVLDKSIPGNTAIDLNLSEEVALVDNFSSQIQEIPTENRSDLFPETYLVNLIAEIGEGATLLILGEPGSGKTITLLKLAQYLINEAEKEESQPIPVVFNLASWQNRFKTLEEWLLEEFTLKYQIPKNVATGWLKKQQLQLLLDGLDEVSPEASENCVIALNNFLLKHGLTEVIVCSRLQNYLQLSNRLKFQQAIRLHPLTEEQIDQYLTQAGQELKGVKQLIQEDPIFTELAKSPLMLSIMALAYQGKSAQELLTINSSSERRLDLFQAYVKRMFFRQRHENNDQVGTFPENKTRHYLKWLAQKMERLSQSEFLIESMQPQELLTPFEHRIYQGSIAFVIMTLWGIIHLGLLGFHHSFQGRLPLTPGEGFLKGVIGGIIAGLICGLSGGIIGSFKQEKIAQMINGIIWGITYGTVFFLIWKTPGFGVAYGILYGLIGCLIYRTIHRAIETVELLQWSWKKASLYALVALIIGLSLTLSGSLGLIKSLIISIGILFIFAFTKRNIIEFKSIIPNQGIWNSLANAKRLFLIVGGLTGIFMALSEVREKSSVLSVQETLIYGIVNGLVDGTILGLLAGLIGAKGSGISCLKHLTLRFILWRKGYIPWNYQKFLDQAVELIFLRRIGGSYRFIHRTLREYWAQLS